MRSRWLCADRLGSSTGTWRMFRACLAHVSFAGTVDLARELPASRSARLWYRSCPSEIQRPHVALVGRMRRNGNVTLVVAVAANDAWPQVAALSLAPKPSAAGWEAGRRFVCPSHAIVSIAASSALLIASIRYQAMPALPPRSAASRTASRMESPRPITSRRPCSSS